MAGFQQNPKNLITQLIPFPIPITMYPGEELIVRFDTPGISGPGYKRGQKRFTGYTKNLNAIHAISNMIAEYFRPAIALPSPICPATRPEKIPWIMAAWANNLL